MKKNLSILLDIDETTKLLLFRNTFQNYSHTKIFGNLTRTKSFNLFEERLLLLRKVYFINDSNNSISPFTDTFSNDFIWNYILSISQKLMQTPNTIYGIAGPPGSGKSTLANAIVTCITMFNPKIKAVAISLDDFYFSKSERERLGIKWRGQPGSHNINLAISFLDSFKRKDEHVIIPHFDHSLDDCAPSEIINGPINVLIFEGWFVGMPDFNYETIARQIDFLIYLDCSTDFSKMRRFKREEKNRSQSNNKKGMSNEKLNLFWDEVLEPGITKWVLPIKSSADLIINMEIEYNYLI